MARVKTELLIDKVLSQLLSDKLEIAQELETLKNEIKALNKTMHNIALQLPTADNFLQVVNLASKTIYKVDEEERITIKQAAETLSVNLNTFRHWIREQKLVAPFKTENGKRFFYLKEQLPTLRDQICKIELNMKNI